MSESKWREARNLTATATEVLAKAGWSRKEWQQYPHWVAHTKPKRCLLWATELNTDTGVWLSTNTAAAEFWWEGVDDSRLSPVFDTLEQAITWFVLSYSRSAEHV